MWFWNFFLLGLVVDENVQYASSSCSCLNHRSSHLEVEEENLAGGQLGLRLTWQSGFPPFSKFYTVEVKDMLNRSRKIFLNESQCIIESTPELPIIHSMHYVMRLTYLCGFEKPIVAYGRFTTSPGASRPPTDLMIFTGAKAAILRWEVPAEMKAKNANASIELALRESDCASCKLIKKEIRLEPPYTLKKLLPGRVYTVSLRIKTPGFQSKELRGTFVTTIPLASAMVRKLKVIPGKSTAVIKWNYKGKLAKYIDRFVVGWFPWAVNEAPRMHFTSERTFTIHMKDPHAIMNIWVIPRFNFGNKHITGKPRVTTFHSEPAGQQ